MVRLVALAETAQDRHGVLDGGLADHYGLEAAFKGGVLLDMLAVLIQGGRADAVQFAARQHRLEQIGGVHRALGLAGAQQLVHLVDEEDDLALGCFDLVEHALEAFLELTAVLGAGDQAAEVERDDGAVLEAFRHVALDDAHRQALDDRGLADAGFADQHRVVLGAS